MHRQTNAHTHIYTHVDAYVIEYVESKTSLQQDQQTSSDIMYTGCDGIEKYRLTFVCFI